MFEHPTAAEVSEFLSSQLLVVMEHNAQEVAVVSTVPEQLVGAHQLRVGLVGMACKLAGGKSAPDQLWSSLLSQTSQITHSPPQRWQGVCTSANAPAALLAGAFLADELHSVLAVEHGGFSAADAKQLDMHIQLLLDTSVEALVCGHSNMDSDNTNLPSGVTQMHAEACSLCVICGEPRTLHN